MPKLDHNFVTGLRRTKVLFYHIKEEKGEFSPKNTPAWGGGC